MQDDEARLEDLSGDDRIVQEAHTRWKRCAEHYGDAYKNHRNDTKFAHADPRNNDQWPEGVFKDRDGESRPCLTINIVRVHNDMIINEALRNKSSIKIRPTGGKASFETAQVMQSIIRRIEYISKASMSYRHAMEGQTDGGVGFIKLETAYMNNRTFDQDIYIRRCRNPLCVYLDPDYREFDASDANYGFEFEKMSRSLFRTKYPGKIEKIGQRAAALGNDELWLSDKEIMVAMYHRRTPKKDTFISYVVKESGARIEKTLSQIKKESGEAIAAALVAQIKEGVIDGKMRSITDHQVEWFEIAGDTIIDRGDWAGRYVPLIPCIGREVIIDGKLDWKGHTRALIDAQRMLNYNASASVEFGALQSKAPYVGPARAFEGQEQWKDANVKNYAFLTYSDIDEDAPEGLQQIAKPERQQPPTSAPVFQQGMQDSERQIMMISGQFQAQMGQEDQQSAASGKAINERQRQSETATYHFVDHQADMLRNAGTQLLDLIPKIYDTERVLFVIGEDGTERWIKIDPNSQEAIQELKKEKDQAAEIAFNPRIGEYDCMSDPGPNYATQRQEAWNAISIILQQNMELALLIGDQLFKYGDFPGAEEIAERLRREIQATKPYLFGDDDPNVAAAQKQLQQLQALNAELVQKMADMQLRLRGKEEKRDIEASNAETNRMKVMIDFLTKTMLSPADRDRLEHEIMLRTHDAALDAIRSQNETAVAQAEAGK